MGRVQTPGMKTTLALLFCLTALRPLGAAEIPLRLDPAHSRVDIEVKATVDSFVGRLDRYEAEVSIDSATGAVSGARFAFHFKDIHTGREDRDEQMHLWQDTAHHPDGVFVLSKLERETAGNLVATGELTLHGVRRELTFPVTVARDGALYAIDGDAAFDTRLFGLPVIKKLLVLKVDPRVHVRFHLRGRLEGVTSAG